MATLLFILFASMSSHETPRSSFTSYARFYSYLFLISVNDCVHCNFCDGNPRRYGSVYWFFLLGDWCELWSTRAQKSQAATFSLGACTFRQAIGITLGECRQLMLHSARLSRLRKGYHLLSMKVRFFRSFGLGIHLRGVCKYRYYHCVDAYQGPGIPHATHRGVSSHLH